MFGATSRLLVEAPLNESADARNTNWCHIDTLLYALLTHSGIEFAMGASRRRTLRKQLNLQGEGCSSMVSDVATHFFCAPCAVAQESMEVKKFRQRAQKEASLVEQYRDNQKKMAEEYI